MIFNDPVLTIGSVTYGAAASDRSAGPTAYGGLELTWGMGTGLDHPDPATLAFDVSIRNLADAPTIGERVTLTVTVGVMPPFVLFDGQVDSLRHTRRRMFHDPTGGGSDFDAVMVRVSAIDWLGILARRTLADDPWPVEAAGDRAQRIAALLPDIPWDDLAVPGGGVAGPRDVDKFSALDALQRTFAIANARLASGANGLRPAPPLLWPDRLALIDGYAHIQRRTMIQVPSRAVHDVDRVQLPESVVNRVTIEYRPLDDAQETYTNEASAVKHGEMGWSLATDSLTLTSTLDRIARDTIRVAAGPEWALDSDVEVMLDVDRWTWDTNPVNIGFLCSPDGRNGSLIELRDPADDVPAVVRVIGGTLTLAPETLTLTVEPPARAVPTSSSFATADGAGARFDEIHLSFWQVGETSEIVRF